MKTKKKRSGKITKGKPIEAICVLTNVKDPKINGVIKNLLVRVFKGFSCCLKGSYPILCKDCLRKR